MSNSELAEIIKDLETVQGSIESSDTDKAIGDLEWIIVELQKMLKKRLD